MENIAQETGNKISLKVEEKDEKKETKAKSDKNKKEKSLKESLVYDTYISITIDLKGGYQGFVDFLNKLENTRNYVNVISVQAKVEKVAEDDEINKRDFSIFKSSDETNKNISGEKIEKNILHSTIYMVLYTKK